MMKASSTTSVKNSSRMSSRKKQRQTTKGRNSSSKRQRGSSFKTRPKVEKKEIVINKDQRLRSNKDLQSIESISMIKEPGAKDLPVDLKQT